MSEIEPPASTVAAPPPGRWARASVGDRTAYVELADLYWYPVYAWLRAAGQSAGVAAAYCGSFFADLVQGPPPGQEEPTAVRLREYLLIELRRALVGGFPEAQTPAVITVDAGAAERSYARERAGTEDEVYARRWSLRVLELCLEGLRGEYKKDEKTELFDALKPFLSYHDSEGGYTEVAKTVQMSGSAFHLQVFNFRKRYRALLRSLIMDTLRHAEDADSELTALLVAAT